MEFPDSEDAKSISDAYFAREKAKKGAMTQETLSCHSGTRV